MVIGVSSTYHARRGGWGSIWHLTRAVPVPPDQDLVADDRRRHHVRLLWLASAIRQCRHLVDFCFFHNERVCLAKVLNGLMDHDPIKISIYVINIRFSKCTWRARHHDRVLATVVPIILTGSLTHTLENLPRLVPPVSALDILTTEIYGQNEFSIYRWDDYNDKTRCFYYDDFIPPSANEEKVGIDVDIVPKLMNNFRMRNYYDNNGI